jgi:hypothetical protein
MRQTQSKDLRSAHSTANSTPVILTTIGRKNLTSNPKRSPLRFFDSAQSQNGNLKG